MKISYKLQRFPFSFKPFIQLNITNPQLRVFQELPINNNHIMTNYRQMFLALCWKTNKTPHYLIFTFFFFWRVIFFLLLIFFATGFIRQDLWALGAFCFSCCSSATAFLFATFAWCFFGLWQWLRDRDPSRNTKVNLKNILQITWKNSKQI